MKSKVAKIMVAALAVTACMPVSAFAAETSGSFDTSFDIYSPALTIKVPVNANIQVNPFSDSTATDVTKFSVASNSIDIWNASVDVDKNIGIPINVTVRAAITSKGEDVVTEYNTFTENATSTNKRVNLNLSTAGTAATLAVKSGDAAAFDTNKHLDMSKYVVSGDADYSSPTDEVAITKFGSLLSVDIGEPTTSATGNDSFSNDPTKVTPTVGSFAVTGIANAGADWKKDDVAVTITYDVRASKARSFTTPTIATAPTFTSTGTADLKITVPNIGEAKVTDIAVHNDAGDYKDYVWAHDAFEVDYTTTAGSAIITIPKADSGLAYLAGDDFKGKAQDLAIALSDGRMVVSTLTVN